MSADLLSSLRAELLGARLLARAPRVAAYAAASLILADQAGNIWQMREATKPVIPSSVVRPRRPQPDLQQLPAASLFGAAPAKPAANPEDAPPSAAELALKGTIAGDRPEHGAAIIVARSSSRFYRVGESVGDAKLRFVYADRAVLERDGVLETIRMPKSAIAVAPPLLAAAPAASNRHGRTFIDHQGRVVDQDPSPLEGVLRLVDTYDPSGTQMRGFRVFPVADGAVLQALGLNPGDLVTAVNGRQLKDLGGRAQVLEALQSGATTSVTVERQGQKMTLTLRLADAAQRPAS